MAGGVLKSFGIPLIVLGALLLAGGLAAAAMGAYQSQSEQDKGVFANPQHSREGEQLAVVGLGGAAVGLVLLVLGIVLTVAGASRSRRALERQALTASAASPATVAPAAPTAAPSPRSRAGWVVAGVVGLALLLALAMVLATSGGPGGSGLFSSGQPSPAAQAVQSQDFSGHVQGGRAPVVGGVNTGTSTATHQMTPKLLSGVLSGTLNWTPSSPAAGSLSLILEVGSGSQWKEVARGEGGPGLVVRAPAGTFGSDVRARVFAGGTSAVDQDYKLTLTIAPS